MKLLSANRSRVTQRGGEAPGYLVEVRRRFSFHRSELGHRLLLDGHAEVVAVLYPGDEQLHPHFDLQSRGQGFRRAAQAAGVRVPGGCCSPCYISL